MGVYVTGRGQLLQTGTGVKDRRAGMFQAGTMRGSAKQIQQALGAIERVVSDAAKEMEQRQVRAFDSGGHGFRGGKQWNELELSTLEHKRKHGWPPDILVRDGTLALSISSTVTLHKSSRGFRYVIRTIASAPWGRFHATGFVHYRSGNFVAPRPPVEITTDDLKHVVGRIRNALSAVGL